MSSISCTNFVRNTLVSAIAVTSIMGATTASAQNYRYQVQPYPYSQPYTGAGSTMQPSQQYLQQQEEARRRYEQQRIQQAEEQRLKFEQLAEQSRRDQQAAAMRKFADERYYKANPLERPTYKFVERATPVVGFTRDCAFGIITSIPPVFGKKDMAKACLGQVANIPD